MSWPEAPNRSDSTLHFDVGILQDFLCSVAFTSTTVL
jgi:hypothetical protein